MHQAAFGHDSEEPWNERLARHSLLWVTARADDELVGFVNVIGDGGAHAVLLDTAVHPEHQRAGIGVGLVREATAEATRLGCEWLHVDYEPHLAAFYEDACGMRPTSAALLRLE
ncbi:GNAT family N-acetyltransferase [Cryptosporangium sp. NPDC048952]|uniref:GNAT family N-acetyltransferase n=1 Tax=Cryptosporangium sp. NPDC048952 TaxID=3363961 RepID=UPI0037212ABB